MENTAVFVDIFILRSYTDKGDKNENYTGS